MCLQFPIIDFYLAVNAFFIRNSRLFANDSEMVGHLLAKFESATEIQSIALRVISLRVQIDREKRGMREVGARGGRA